VLIDVQSGGDDFTLIGCRIEQKSQVTEAITIASGANDVAILDCEFLGLSAGPDNAIVVEGASERLRVEGCLFDYLQATNVDKGAILIEHSNNSTHIIKDCRFFGVATAAGDGPVVVASQAGISNDNCLIIDCWGVVTDLSDVFPAGVSDQISVINSFWTEVGSSQFSRPVLNANENWYAPATTVVV
jgi:hypothetical protein